MNLTFKPIDQWPGKLRAPGNRKRGTFITGYHSIVRTLQVEVRHLNAPDAYVLVACNESDLRNDGLLRASAVVQHPGVIVYLPESKQGVLRFACDLYTEWTANVRAVALGMNALRTFERHGIGRGGEQYRGYTALPPGGAIAAAEWASVGAAAQFLASTAGWHPTVKPPAHNCTALGMLYRDAARHAHPDTGGSNDLMAKVSRARDFIAGGGK